MKIEDFLYQVKEWAEQQADINGLLLVGSYARGAARADSDIDLVILTSKPERYLDFIFFAEHFGPVSKWEKEDWGRVTSLRVEYQDGLKVEYGITLPDWAAPPLDAGTLRVVTDGVRIVFDRDNSLDWLSKLRETNHLS